MRTEKEMMDFIIDIAKSDDRVLAAYLKGLRTNPNIPQDIEKAPQFNLIPDRVCMESDVICFAFGGNSTLRGVAVANR